MRLSQMKLVSLFIIIALSACGSADNKTSGKQDMHTYTNHLINETSPYLLQHAHNPVDWYPWGEEAFRRAREEDKPIFLSIGYSACHWCHVMEEESFENEAIAAVMNKRFINIKVDREERPDVDQVYMKFVQFSTGSGGWPMSVFLTPDKKPFYGGTYFPPEDRYGRPGFKKLLVMVSDYFQNQKEQLQKNLQQVEQAFQTELAESGGSEIPTRKNFNSAAEQLSRLYEPEFGGIGNAPKFPAVQALTLFLRAYKNSGQQHYLDMVEFTLKNMARGGIYDQLGGGFARYSVDKEWFAPHFEKMLYDNAQLATLYLDTYVITRNAFYLNVSNEILEFVRGEMTSEEGGFYSSFDADSEGEEGLFYLWTKGEVYRLLDEETAALFCRRFDVRKEGNFEHKNILHISASLKELADEFKRPEAEIKSLLLQAKTVLLKERATRIPPHLDKKIITAWNGLMLSAFARNYQVTGREAYKTVIEKNTAFLREKLGADSDLLHTYKDGQAKYSAYLDDYAALIQGLLDAYEAVFDENNLRQAIALTRQVNEHFWDPLQKGYFYTSSKQEQLIQRMKDDSDQSIPSGTGIMALNLQRIFALTDDAKLFKTAEQIFAKYGAQYVSNPYGYASHLNALDFYLAKPNEIVIILPEGGKAGALLQAVRQKFIPNKVLVVQTAGSASDSPVSASVLQGRKTVNGKPTAYVCRDFSCSLPLTNSAELLELLQ